MFLLLMNIPKHGLRIDIRINALSVQLIDKAEMSSKVSTSISETLNENLRAIECHIGPESLLLKQLSLSSSLYESLEDKVEEIKPILGSLDTSVKALTATESNLIHDLKAFDDNSTKIQIPASNSALEIELSSISSENSQMQLRLHDQSLELDSLRRILCEKDETQRLQKLLTDSIASQKAAETRNKQLEIELNVLQRDIKSTEQKIFQELDHKNTALIYQMRSQHEMQLNRLQEERDDLDRMSGELLPQLGTVQQSLVSSKHIDNVVTADFVKAEAQAIIRNLRDEREITVRDRSTSDVLLNLVDPGSRTAD